MSSPPPLIDPRPAPDSRDRLGALGLVALRFASLALLLQIVLVVIFGGMFAWPWFGNAFGFLWILVYLLALPLTGAILLFVLVGGLAAVVGASKPAGRRAGALALVLGLLTLGPAGALVVLSKALGG